MAKQIRISWNGYNMKNVVLQFFFKKLCIFHKFDHK